MTTIRGLLSPYNSITMISLWLLLLLPCVVEAKVDRNQAHGHRGKLKPYKPGPFPNLRLTSQDEAQLAAGKAVMKQTQGDSTAGGAICVQDVDAPKAAVWNQILDLDSYKGKVNKVNHCSNYHVSKKNPQEVKIKTKMVLGVLPGYAYESYYDHTFHPQHDSVTWTLDYDKTSDMDDVAGHWHLEPLDGGRRTRVFYACDIQLKGSVPGPVMNYLSKAALKAATAWVKKESEAHPNDTRVAEQYGYKVPKIPALTTPLSHREPASVGGGGGWFGFARRGGALIPVRRVFNFRKLFS